MISNPPPTLPNVMDLLLDAICVVDADGRFVFVSAAFETVFGYSPEEVIGKPMIEFVYPEDRDRTRQAAAEIMSGLPKTHFQNRYVRKDGKVIHILWSARWSPADRMRFAVAHDITELKRAESMQAALYAISEAAHSTEDLSALFQRIHQIIGGLLPAHNFFVALHDPKKDELSFPYFVDEYDDPPAPRPLDAGTLTAEIIRTRQALLLTVGDNTVLPAHIETIVGRDSLQWLGVPLSSPQGVIGVLVVQSYSDEFSYTEQDKELLQYVSIQVATAIERKQAEARLLHVASYDQLTDLPNRELFQDRLQIALTRARRDRTRLALLYIDLDKFKQVNDSHGHSTGDLLLKEVATRITGCVRGSDTVARLGGDEFVVLLNDIARQEQAAVIAEKIRAALDHPFELAGQCLHISCSIGSAIFPDHGDDNKHLVRHADNAMYGAKKQGGNCFLMAASPVLSDDGLA